MIVRRREFVILLASAGIGWPRVACGQPASRRPLIGFPDGKSQSSGQALTSAFLQGLKELGYEEGRSIDIAYRFADGRDERLPELAEELVGLNPAVIVAPGVNAAVAGRKVTTTIPIVSWALADAQHLGLVESYARPGRNVTGITPYIEGLPAKQMELAREVVPAARKVGLVGNTNDPKAPPQRHELEEAGRSLNVKVIFSELRNLETLDATMQFLAGERVDIVIVLQTAMTLSERQHIAAAAVANRLPTVFGYRENIDAGGLISYGVNLRWCSHRAAAYVDKILRGSMPGDLPLEFPPRLEMAINLRTAKILGLTVPPTLIARADEVIE
jgi:putative tryptophan/tyrosine transport system substrate-binding protein